jgi:ribonuclease HI
VGDRAKSRDKRAVLETLAGGFSVEKVLEKYPAWTADDVRTLLLEAARSYPVDGAEMPPGTVVAFIDGASRGNPGEAGYGVVFRDTEGKTLAELSGYLGKTTNNVAEYSALLAALEEALSRGWKSLRIMADSELLVRQLRGVYRVKSPNLVELYTKGLALCGSLESWSVEHVRREGNTRADELANQAIDMALKGRR